MPGRITPLVNGEFYHIFNRGVNKQSIFFQPRDYHRFQQTFFYYHFFGPKPKFSSFSKFNLNGFKPISDKKCVDIISYCLMPNHFHFLVRQNIEGGISHFMSQLCNSYTKYINTKYNQTGPILQGSFKAIRIESDEQLIHLSRYIHLNPIVSKISRNLNKYKWSSYQEYIINNIICSTSEILNFFPNKDDYRKFVEAQIELGKTLEIIKHHDLDDL